VVLGLRTRAPEVRRGTDARLGRLIAIDTNLKVGRPDETRDLVLDAWSMVVPNSVIDEYVRHEPPSRLS
jgi:hypothetical protein